MVGILQDDVDPLVSVMKVDKAPLESYADIGGLEKQIQEIKEVDFPLSFLILLFFNLTSFFFLIVLFVQLRDDYIYFATSEVTVEGCSGLVP